MSRRRTVDAWRRDVLASKAPQLTGSVKVLLLYLADHMHPDRKVSIPRAQIADDLGCHEQRIAERFKKAVDAEYLTNVIPGHKGTTAVYQGCWPSNQSVPITGTQTVSKRTDSRDAIDPPKAVRNSGAKRTAPLDATSRANLLAATTADQKRYGERACFYCCERLCYGECLEQQEETPTTDDGRWTA